MIETTEAQRARILAANPDLHEWEYDLLVDLGYEPESLDGFWKLPADQTYDIRNNHVIIRELVRDPDGHEIKMDGNRLKTRLVAHPLPHGWTVIDDQHLTETGPHYQFISPRMRAA